MAGSGCLLCCAVLCCVVYGQQGRAGFVGEQPHLGAAHLSSLRPALSGSPLPFPPGRCGDSCMPGIGVPAAAASGMICANTLAPIGSHLSLLGELAL